MDDASVPEVVRDLGSSDDSTRKLAAFKLQSIVGDPSAADHFVQEGGLTKLQIIALTGSGNTLAYALASLSNLLQIDQGWTLVDATLVKRLVELIVGQPRSPLVNILRGAMSILASLVSRPQASHHRSAPLKEAMEEYPQFLEMLVARLSSADHALSAHALQLINSLTRNSIVNDGDSEWQRFVKGLQDLGVIKAVYTLMQSTGLQDLAQQLLEFQGLTKVLLRKWKDVSIDLERHDHRRGLKAILHAGFPTAREDSKDPAARVPVKQDRWRRLGFSSEAPSADFDSAGFLGLLDLTDFIKKGEDGFRRLLLEQATKPSKRRCPVARASLSVTTILYEHFEVDQTDADREDQNHYVALESRSNFDDAFQPFLLQWSRLHTSGVQAFLRLWAASNAEVDDYEKVEVLVRILLAQVLETAPRTKDIQEVEEDLAKQDLKGLRDLQLTLLEGTHEEVWGSHLRQVKQDLYDEALQFVREQRIRCLLEGAWFPNAEHGDGGTAFTGGGPTRPWRFVRLSYNRRHLHYDDFGHRTSPSESAPALDSLASKINLASVSAVVGSPGGAAQFGSADADDSDSSASTIRSANPGAPRRRKPTQTITLRGRDGAADAPSAPLLVLRPSSPDAAAEWLDGLLLLLEQAPRTDETARLISLVAGYGLRIRLLNVRAEEVFKADEGARGARQRSPADRDIEVVSGYNGREIVLPDREGVDEPFYYAVGED